MTRVLPFRYLSGITDFFIQAEKAVLSFGSIDFPNLCTLQELVEDALKKKPSAKEELTNKIHHLMEPLRLYFIPIEIYFSTSLNLNDIQENIEYEEQEKQRKYKRNIADLARERKLAEKLASSTKYSEEGKERLNKVERKNARLNERHKKDDKAFNDLQLPLIKELNQYEKYPLPPLDRLISKKLDNRDYRMVRDRLYKDKILTKEKQIPENEVLYDKYQKFWKELCEYIEYPLIPEWLCYKPIVLSPYIKIEDFWLIPVDYTKKVDTAIKVREKKCPLAKLYEVLVEEEYIEGGKLGAFIAIFSGYRFDYENDLPIKWLCRTQRTGKNYKESNLTVLYYLIVALKNWKSFLSLPSQEENAPLVKELLLGTDKAKIAEFFIHANLVAINPESLRFTFNKYALTSIKELLAPLIIQ